MGLAMTFAETGHGDTETRRPYLGFGIWDLGFGI